VVALAEPALGLPLRRGALAPRLALPNRLRVARPDVLVQQPKRPPSALAASTEWTSSPVRAGCAKGPGPVSAACAVTSSVVVSCSARIAAASPSPPGDRGMRPQVVRGGDGAAGDEAVRGLGRGRGGAGRRQPVAGAHAQIAERVRQAAGAARIAQVRLVGLVHRPGSQTQGGILRARSAAIRQYPPSAPGPLVGNG
jgi:hypothetical protein